MRGSLFVELLESRTVPSGAQPSYVLLPQSGGATPFSTSAPTGATPAQIRHAYGFDQISFNNGSVAGDGSGMTIAIVDAYDDPNIAGDLHQFDLQFGLPDPTFKKVNQSGGTTLPAANAGWASEIALDVEWAHAIAPKAGILLVEASSNSYSNLFAAVRYAARQPGVAVVSMSFGGGEFSGETSYDSSFLTPSGHAGVTFVASSGDSGAPASYPAASPNVLAVGGTTLSLDAAGNILDESTWSGSGGGISSVESQPSYQQGIVSQTSTARANPDVAYDADPNTGFPVYDSYNNPAGSRWSQFGGTSDAAPQWAALIAIADHGRVAAGLGTLDGPTQTLPLLYSLPAADFHDIASGSTFGSPPEPAASGYDLATGRGSPVAYRIVADLAGQTPTSTDATHFSLSTSSSTTAGASLTVVVTALDADGNVASNYRGTVSFSSSDLAAVLPANYTFTSADAGIHAFTVVLNSIGNQSITVADLANGLVAGSVTVTVGSSSTNGVIEDFESAELWNVVGAYPTAFLSTAAAHDGTYGLDDYNGSDWIYRNDSAAHVQAGDAVSVWLAFAGAANGRAYFGFGATSLGTLSLVAAPNTSQLILQLNLGYGFVNLAAVSRTYLPNHWYRLEVDWGANGAITGKLFNSDGKTLLRTVRATTTSITSGGIAFRATGYDKFWDTVTVAHGVNSAARPQTPLARPELTSPLALPGGLFGDANVHQLEAWRRAMWLAAATDDGRPFWF